MRRGPNEGQILFQFNVELQLLTLASLLARNGDPGVNAIELAGQHAAICGRVQGNRSDAATYSWQDARLTTAGVCREVLKILGQEVPDAL